MCYLFQPVGAAFRDTSVVTAYKFELYDPLRAALDDAAKAHHDYETAVPKGERDRQWPGFYAAYVLGRLHDFMIPSELVGILESVETTGGLSEAAAGTIVKDMGQDG